MLGQFAGTITHSREHYAQFVTNAYQQYLGRQPDDAGLASWVSHLQAGLTDEQLEAGFIGSAEYIANHGGTGAAWVQSLYHDILGRTASLAEFTLWLNQLQVQSAVLDVLQRSPTISEFSTWEGMLQ